MILAERVSSAIRKSGIKCDGINLLLADGEAAGQEVPHIHLHLIPRFKGDGFGFRFPEGYGKESERKDLDALSEKIRQQLAK